VTSAPHEVQKRAPLNIGAKQDAHVTVASGDPQYEQRAASESQGAPQPGQFMREAYRDTPVSG
jgi:hypothetical protein